MEAYKPSTLQDVIDRTRDLQDLVPKNRFSTKTNFPIKDKDKKPFQQEWPKKTWSDDNTRKDPRRKNCASLVRNHGFQVTGAQGKQRTTI